MENTVYCIIQLMQIVWFKFYKQLSLLPDNMNIRKIWTLKFITKWNKGGGEGYFTMVEQQIWLMACYEAYIILYLSLVDRWSEECNLRVGSEHHTGLAYHTMVVATNKFYVQACEMKFWQYMWSKKLKENKHLIWRHVYFCRYRSSLLEQRS